MIECSFDKRPIFPQKVWKWQNGWSNFRRKFRKLILWTTNMPLRECSQKFWPMSELYFEVWKTKKKFFKDIVLLKMFLRLKTTNGDLATLVTFYPKIQKSLAPSPEKLEKLFFEKLFFFLRGDPLGPIECGFFQKMSTIDRFGHGTSGKISTKGSSGCVIMWTQSKKFCKVRRFFDQSENQKNFLKIFFPREIVFGFIQKWQMPRLFSVQKSKSEEMEKGDFNWKRLSLQDGLWDDRMQFWQTRIFFQKSLKVTKWFIELVPKNVPLDSQHVLIAKTILPTYEGFLLKIWKGQKTPPIFLPQTHEMFALSPKKFPLLKALFSSKKCFCVYRLHFNKKMAMHDKKISTP